MVAVRLGCSHGWSVVANHLSHTCRNVGISAACGWTRVDRVSEGRVRADGVMRAQREAAAGIEESVVSVHAGSIVVIEGVRTVAFADREAIEGAVRTVCGISGIDEVVFCCYVLRVVDVEITVAGAIPLAHVAPVAVGSVVKDIDRSVGASGRVILDFDAVTAIQKRNIVFDYTLLGIGLAAALRHIPGVEVKALAIRGLGAGTRVAVEVVPGEVTGDKVMGSRVVVSGDRLPDVESASTTAIHCSAGSVIGNVPNKCDVVGGYCRRSCSRAKPACCATIGYIIGENDMVHIL